METYPELRPPLPKEGTPLLANGFTDDWKFFYGIKYVFLKRDIIRLICRFALFANANMTEHKVRGTFNPQIYFDLSPAEEEPTIKYYVPAIVVNNGTFRYCNMSLDFA